MYFVDLGESSPMCLCLQKSMFWHRRYYLQTTKTLRQTPFLHFHEPFLRLAASSFHRFSDVDTVFYLSNYTASAVLPPGLAGPFGSINVAFLASPSRRYAFAPLSRALGRVGAIPGTAFFPPWCECTVFLFNYFICIVDFTFHEDSVLFNNWTISCVVIWRKMGLISWSKKEWVTFSVSGI